MNENKRTKLSQRPLLFGIVCMVLAILGAYIGGYAVTALIALLLKSAGIFASFDADAKIEVLTYVAEAIIPIMAAICMYVFCRINRVNGYRGAVRIRCGNCCDVWVCIGIFAVVTIVRYFLGLWMMPDGLRQMHIGMSSVLMSVYAGVSEEIVIRGIPMAVMMRSRPDTKRIRRAVLLTAVVFGVVHLLNGFNGGMGLFQVLFTFVVGLFLGGVYLRTGSILVTIVFHILYDILATSTVFPDTLPASYIVFYLSGQMLPLIFLFVIMRKSKIEEIKETWTNIWVE